MIKIYRKTATIKAKQFDGSAGMIEKYGIQSERSVFQDGGFNFYVGSTRRKPIRPGEWIITGDDGEHWPIADSIFKKTYAELPVIPSYVAKYMESCKKSGEALFSAIFNAEYMVEDYTMYPGPTLRYISRHCETFARAWLDGYQTEGEDE